MYKTKSGEKINTNEKPQNYIKKEINKNDSQARILRIMIEAGRPLRPFEIVELSEMNKTRVHNNLNNMLLKGSILVKEVLNIKIYYPQLFFLDRDVLKILYEIMLPFIEVLDKNSDYSQLGIDNKEAILENIQMLLKLFPFDIEGYKK